MTTAVTTRVLSPALRASVIRRLVAEEGLDKQLAARSTSELEKFLVFCVANPGGRYTPNDEVDTAWHALLAHTAAYRDLCSALTGGSFIDHIPPRSAEEAHVLVANFPRTVWTMLAQGVDIDPSLWVEPSHSSCGCGS